MNRLSELLKKRMKTEGLSVRDAGKLIGVSHATVARAVNGETVEVDTLVKIAEFLGVPVEDILDVRERPSEIAENVMMALNIEPELYKTLEEITQKINNGEIDTKILVEIASFAAYRLQVHLSSES